MCITCLEFGLDRLQGAVETGTGSLLDPCGIIRHIMGCPCQTQPHLTGLAPGCGEVQDDAEGLLQAPSRKNPRIPSALRNRSLRALRVLLGALQQRLELLCRCQVTHLRESEKSRQHRILHGKPAYPWESLIFFWKNFHLFHHFSTLVSLWAHCA